MQPSFEVTGRRQVEYGGLQFEATFRAPAGATLRVLGEVEGQNTELLRFDDFVESPHYHVPASGPATLFDQAKLGEPLAWFVAQLRDHLTDLLTEAGYGAILTDLDPAAVADHAGEIRMAVEACTPQGYVRVPGVGLQRATA
jgi:hypothetical protein